MNTCLRQNVSLGYIISAVFFFIAAALIPDTVLADSLTLYAVDSYTSGSLKATDQTGAASKTSIESFNQLYNLYMDKIIFPNLVLDAGGLFGRNNTVIRNGSDQHSASNQYNMFADIRLNTRPFSSSIGYSKRTDATTSLANVEERYSFLFDWRPEAGLPSFDLNYTKNFNYDDRHIFNDISNDQLLLSLRYDPFSNVRLNYDMNYIDSVDKLNGAETKSTSHSGRIIYDDRFFKNRVNIAATYDISRQAFESIRSEFINGTNAVRLQLFPVHGLSGISDILNPTQTPLMITLNENPALIDGGLTASAGINLGLTSGLQTVPPPPRQEWNIGVDFITPTQLNSLFIWVDKDVTKIADLFKWDIYVSDDNLTWTKKFTLIVAPSGFSTLPLPHFVMNFPSPITARFVKAVVKPLDSIDQTTIIFRGLTPADFNNIAVTELQAFLLKASTGSSTKRNSISESTLSQHFNFNGRAKLLDSRDLFYDLSLFLSKPSAASQLTAFLSNGLSFSQKFGGIFTFNARAGRNDNFQVNGHGTEYQYSAGLSATPFATLNDSLLYSGHHTINPAGATNTQNSIVLYNTAVLYPGINALLNGGVSFGTLETGQSSKSLQANTGLTIVPNPMMNLNLNYSISNSSLSGGSKAAISSTTYAALASATFTPVSALYLFASVQLSKANILQTLTSYGLNFSPFPGGELQFHFTYNETLGPESNEKSRTMSPSLRWNIRPGASLDLNYSMQQSRLTTQKSDSKILSSILTIAL